MGLYNVPTRVPAITMARNAAHTMNKHGNQPGHRRFFFLLELYKNIVIDKSVQTIIYLSVLWTFSKYSLVTALRSVGTDD